MKELNKEFDAKMQKTVDVVVSDFASVRAGRANAAVLDRIVVDYYGTPTPINQVAAISSPDPRSLAIQPWDMSLLKAIEKAIQTSDLGINPQNDGRLIRLPSLSSPRSAARSWSSRCASTPSRARWPSAISAGTP
jgi:ribosome recycling factor